MTDAKRRCSTISRMLSTELRAADFDYRLPQDLIAQEPTQRREDSRLMVLHRAGGRLEHTSFAAITDYLRPGDVLVANRSKVIPARVFALKPTGGRVEFLLLRRLASANWTAMARPGRGIRPGADLAIPGSDLRIRVGARRDDSTWEIEFLGEGDVEAQVTAAGSTPFPPYIRPNPALNDRYQTVYADRDGSVAAPTAGLHFSEDLLSRIAAIGAKLLLVTLHVGAGTFKPVTVDRIAGHYMHFEWGEITPDVATDLNRARAEGRRVFAIGTTSARLLESASAEGAVTPFSGETSLFIYPGFRFHVVDGLVTNFHLPRSTLLMLVSAFAGREEVLHAYDEAIRLRYRFYSFGDAMLVL